MIIAVIELSISTPQRCVMKKKFSKVIDDCLEFAPTTKMTELVPYVFKFWLAKLGGDEITVLDVHHHEGDPLKIGQFEFI